MQRNWSPSSRFLVGAAGAASAGLIAYALSDGARERREPGAVRRVMHFARHAPAAR